MKMGGVSHFIPTLKDGEFVTLRAPYVLKPADKNLERPEREVGRGQG